MRAGETLYLPFGWWHQVRTVGLMLGHHGSRWKGCFCLKKFLRRIGGQARRFFAYQVQLVCHLFERIGCLRMSFQRTWEFCFQEFAGDML